MESLLTCCFTSLSNIRFSQRPSNSSEIKTKFFLNNEKDHSFMVTMNTCQGSVKSKQIEHLNSFSGIIAISRKLLIFFLEKLPHQKSYPSHPGLILIKHLVSENVKYLMVESNDWQQRYLHLLLILQLLLHRCSTDKCVSSFWPCFCQYSIKCLNKNKIQTDSIFIKIDHKHSRYKRTMNLVDCVGQK